uniref:Uncharacterized protein n=1 Tax=Palpitomonas bilix TaxID=652834 RepID=A0A7S3G4L6_9EUKA
MRYLCCGGGHALRMLDWQKVAKQVKTKMASECKIEWLHQDDPRFARDNWDAEEDACLVEAVKKHSANNWVEVAVDMSLNRKYHAAEWKIKKEKTGKNVKGRGEKQDQVETDSYIPILRTPFSCQKRYERSHNGSKITSSWTKNEDEKLKAAVHLYGDDNWQEVASYVGTKMGHQCMHRWGKSVDPSIRKGTWRQTEDICLLAAVEGWGRNWAKVAEHVQGRTDVQCRERFVNVLDPSLNRQPWSSQEDDLLLQIIKRVGVGNWSVIAQQMDGTRTDNQCLRRWKELDPAAHSNYCSEKREKKKDKVANFCGRERERPAMKSPPSLISVQPAASSSSTALSTNASLTTTTTTTTATTSGNGALNGDGGNTHPPATSAATAPSSSLSSHTQTQHRSSPEGDGKALSSASTSASIPASTPVSRPMASPPSLFAHLAKKGPATKEERGRGRGQQRPFKSPTIASVRTQHASGGRGGGQQK